MGLVNKYIGIIFSKPLIPGEFILFLIKVMDILNHANHGLDNCY